MALNATTLLADKTTDGSIKNWINYSLVPSATILTMAQAFIYERLRAREMAVEAAVEISEGDGDLALPTGFLDPIKLQLDGDSREVTYVHENLVRRTRDEDGNLFSGTIGEYTILGETMLFDVESDADRTGQLWYFATPDELAATTNETNFLTRRYPQLLLDACLAFANAHRRFYDERDKLLAIVGNSITAANQAADMARRGQFMR